MVGERTADPHERLDERSQKKFRNVYQVHPGRLELIKSFISDKVDEDKYGVILAHSEPITPGEMTIRSKYAREEEERDPDVNDEEPASTLRKMNTEDAERASAGPIQSTPAATIHNTEVSDLNESFRQISKFSESSPLP
ncbi:hypothetical protein MMC12_004682, partial [Toensbergia leucococca]|nr:hypothetical protein [Toensbergia leucococca]